MALVKYQIHVYRQKIMALTDQVLSVAVLRVFSSEATFSKHLSKLFLCS